MVRPLEAHEVDDVAAVLGLARLHQGDGTYLVAWDEATPMAHAHLTTTTPPELQDVEVRDEYRRRGVASTLVAAAEAVCRSRGDAELRVEVSVDNEAARSLYSSLGFRDVGLAPRRVTGTVELRTGPIVVDDTLVTLVKPISA